MVSPMTDVSTQISHELMNDPRTQDCSQHINVAFDRGIATLTGTVPNVQASEAAEEIARRFPEVISVHNELKIKA